MLPAWWSDVARCRELATAAAAEVAVRAAATPYCPPGVPRHLLDHRFGQIVHKPIGRPAAYYIEAGESEAGESDAGESEAGESEAGESEAGESEMGEAGESDSGESISNFPKDEATVELRKGCNQKLEGTFAGRRGEKLGVWDAYLRFTPAGGCSEGTIYLWRGDFITCDAAGDNRAVIVRILGGTKAGGKRASTPTQACYVCLLYCIDTAEWLYATMPNVVGSIPATKADATLMQSIEDKLLAYTPLTVSGAISQASRAAPSIKAAVKKEEKNAAKRARSE